LVVGSIPTRPTNFSSKPATPLLFRAAVIR
jgi:hypothetical protein